MLHESLDGAALAGGVAAFEEHDDALPGLLGPVLHLQQFDLQVLLELFVLGSFHLRFDETGMTGIGLAAGRDLVDSLRRKRLLQRRSAGRCRC